MQALAEPIIWVIRVGENHATFGDPWEFCVTATYNGQSVWLHAGQGRMTKAIWKAISAELRRLGFELACWERVDERGAFRVVTRRIS